MQYSIYNNVQIVYVLLHALNSGLLFSHLGAWWRKKDAFQCAGSAFHTCAPNLRVEERTACAGGEVFEGGGSSPVDSMWVDALQRGRWRPGDLFSAPHHLPPL